MTEQVQLEIWAEIDAAAECELVDEDAELAAIDELTFGEWVERLPPFGGR